ncbi:BTAD domain-containing putative transcriptional regulator [Streptomyces sp. NPDC059092]|uniref:AfsR/SARP family transcriptional regulator n=1 Tax=Streptomyces sp. NPDC059092 TaxID=3346725 RepID=UPI0036AFF650
MDFHLLGPVGLRLDGQRLELGSDKERAVLAALALDVGRPVSIDTLMGRLWDTTPPVHARANTHTYVSRLRRHLRRAGDEPGAPHIDSRAHTYVLEVDSQHVDWFRFQQLVTRAATLVTDGDDEQALALLTGAEQLWQGEALAGLPGEWAVSVRRTLAERRLAATVSRSAAGLRTGRFTDLADELPALADQHPGDEAIAAQLMLARYGCGRYTEALRVHERIRRLLVSEYGSRPGVELNRIHRGILERVAPGELVRSVLGAPGNAHTSGHPTGARTDRAPSTLRSSSSTSSTSSAPTGPGSAPSSLPSQPLPQPQPQPLPPRNLPHQSPLVGRGPELRALSAVIDTAGTDASVITLETVSGMAGVGKTAIAVHMARHLAGRFPAAQLYLDLRAHSPAQEPLSPAEALATLLRLLGAPADEIPVELEGRTALWRTMLAERRAVVVLDDAASAAQVRPLLPGGSASLTIITSRRHLAGLPYALPVHLDVLPAADAIALFRRFAGEDRTRDPEQVDRIVGICGYLPLAIELVANRYRARPSWTLATLAERLARPSGRLAEIRDADQSLRLAFDLSYRTLTGSQRVAFRRLGLHPGADLTVDVAAALLGLPEAVAERLIEDLLACHLLREPEPDRYRFHDLLAEYARGLAISEDSERDCESARCRVIDFYAQAADRADRLLYPRRLRTTGRTGAPVEAGGHADVDAARSWFAAERGNLLAAEKCARTHGHPERAAQLAYSMAGFLDAECHWQDAAAVLEHAVAHWTGTTDRRALCRALLCLGATQANIGGYAEAGETGRRALDIARATGDRDAEAEILRIQGVLSWHMGENRAALVHFQDSFAIKSVSGDMWDKARAYNNVAVSLLYLLQYDRALGHFKNALESFAAAGDRVSVGKTLNNLGDLQIRTGDRGAARRSYEEAISVLESTGNRYDRATARGSLADLLMESGESESALSLYRESLMEFIALGDRKSQADTLIGVGEVYRRAGDGEKASGCYLDALETARAIGASHQVAQVLRRLAQVDFACGRFGAAAERLEEAVATAVRTHDLDEEVGARKVLAEVWLAAGDGPNARAQLVHLLNAVRGVDPEDGSRIRGRLLEVERLLDAKPTKEVGQ